MRLKNRRLEELDLPKSSINPLDNTFERQRIWWSDLLLPGEMVLKGKTFIDCDLVGPAMIFPYRDVTINGGSSIDVDLVCVKRNGHTRNAIVLENCTLVNCRMVRVVFLVHEDVYFDLMNGFKGKTDFLTYTPANPPSWSKKHDPEESSPSA